MILIKFIAQSGYCSRRKAEDFIKQGAVSVNNVVMKKPNYEVKEDDIVACEEQLIVQPEALYVVMHKPIGAITSKNDPSGRPTVMDYLPEKYIQELDPIGRLDFHTSGALLLTNDGKFAYHLSHPKFNVSKTYDVVVSRPLDIELINILRKGVQLEKYFIRPDKVLWSPKKPMNLTITIHSGQNRIIKRIMERLNIFVKKLHRKDFAGVGIVGLKPGESRKLTMFEVNKLKLLFDPKKAVVKKAVVKKKISE